MNVYLIDDDAALRQAVARFMERFGFLVLGEAGNGADALRALSDPCLQLRPDLIISDCQMPVMDGLSFARRFRAMGRPTPMVMLSGQGGEEVVIAVSAAPNGGTLVTGSSYLFDMQVSRFFTTIAPAGSL